MKRALRWDEAAKAFCTAKTIWGVNLVNNWSWLRQPALEGERVLLLLRRLEWLQWPLRTGFPKGTPKTRIRRTQELIMCIRLGDSMEKSWKKELCLSWLDLFGNVASSDSKRPVNADTHVDCPKIGLKSGAGQERSMSESKVHSLNAFAPSLHSRRLLTGQEDWEPRELLLDKIWTVEFQAVANLRIWLAQW